MNLNEYQDKAESTRVYHLVNNTGAHRIIYNALALTGEAGELANVIKKALRSDGFDDAFYLLHKDRPGSRNVSDKVKEEIGDVLWYVAMLSKECGFSLEEIAQGNLDKLAKRHEKNA